jgi:hypothetical protein
MLETPTGDYPLSPSGSKEVTYSFESSNKGSYFDTIPIQYFDGSAWRDTVILSRAFVTDGTRILAVNDTTLDFGTTTLCEERDSLLTIRNTGCDTLIISDTILSGLGFLVFGLENPTVILPGDSVKIVVSTNLDTTGGITTNTGTLAFSSNADNATPPITFTRSVRLPKTYSLHLGMPVTSAKVDEMVRLAVIGEKGLGQPGSGVKQLDFDLALNEDLLEYINSEGTNSVSKTGSHVTISNSTELASDNDTLGVLRFHVYLTKDSTTAITLSNLTLNNNDTSACAPKIASQTTESFTYIYQCGDHFIQHFMRGETLPLKIISIKPNPFDNSTNIVIDALKDAPLSVVVLDVLGRTVLTLHSGASETNHCNFTLDGKKIAPGIYFIRIQQGNEVQTQKVELVK